MSKTYDLPILAFESAELFERWLSDNHNSSSGIWLRMYKKASGKPTVTYQEALRVALCYGWIDAVSNKYDDESYIQRFTPRRARSMWSKRNIGIVQTLIAEGKMKPAGTKEIERAKADGRWDQAYDSPKNMKVPDDFIEELKKDPKAYEFFQSLNKTNTYAIGWRLQTAKKPETRERRKQHLLEMMAKGEKIH